MNKFQTDPAEYKRILDLINCGLRPDELQRVFRYRDAFHFGQALGLNTAGRNESTMIVAIFRKLNGPGGAPTNPLPPTNPPVTKPPAPVVNDTAPECTDCGDMADARGKVWEKASKKKITVSLDLANMPSIMAESDIDQAFSIWAAACGIQFKKLKRGKGDIHFKFADLKGNTLGAAYQSETNRMEDGGMLAGDIFIDYTRQWEFWLLFLTMLHEIGHAIGMPHSDEVGDVMFGRPGAAGNRSLSKNDKRLALVKYPKLPAGTVLK